MTDIAIGKGGGAEITVFVQADGPAQAISIPSEATVRDIIARSGLPPSKSLLLAGSMLNLDDSLQDAGICAESTLHVTSTFEENPDFVIDCDSATLRDGLGSGVICLSQKIPFGEKAHVNLAFERRGRPNLVEYTIIIKQTDPAGVGFIMRNRKANSININVDATGETVGFNVQHVKEYDEWRGAGTF